MHKRVAWLIGCFAAVSVSLFDAMADWMTVPLLHHEGGQSPKRLGLAHPSIAPYGVFGASDGEIVIAIQNEREWAMFCEGVLGEPGLATDERFASNVARVKNRAVLDAHIGKTISRMPPDTVSYRLPVEWPVVPLPISPASSSTTFGLLVVFCSASRSASVTPVMPPPMIRTSAVMSPCRAG